MSAQADVEACANQTQQIIFVAVMKATWHNLHYQLSDSNCFKTLNVMLNRCAIETVFRIW